MRYITLLITTIFFALNVTAQVDKEPLPTENAEISEIQSGNSVYGKVLDIQTNKGVVAASTQLYARLQDENTHKEKDSLIAVMLTKPNGDFYFENVPAYKNLHLVITAVGYGNYDKNFPFVNQKTGGNAPFFKKDLGNIILTRKNERLATITIVADRPALRMGIDKKIFDVDKSITSKGGTAIDVMKNIPSVSVDVDGNVQLRNSSPTIFIDGRPTILTLDQISSDDIDRIEIITNPSAKYDASTTGGIINIILKKNKRYGLNGLVSATVGTPERYSGNVNLNLRQGKFNFFVSSHYNYSDNDAQGKSFRQNKSNGIVDNYFNQNSLNNHARQFFAIRGGVDFFLDNRNTFTLSQGYVNGRFSNIQTQDQEYYDNSNQLTQSGLRNSNSHFQFKRNSSSLLYTHKFPKEGKTIDASMKVNYGGVNDNDEIKNTFYNPDHTVIGDPSLVKNDGANNNNQVTAKIDFVNPLGEDKKIEAGLRSYVNNYSSYFNSYAINNGAETKLPLSNNYKYTEMVQAGYITYTGKLKSIGYQAGLRAEYSKFSGTLIDSAKKFGYEYPSEIKNIWDALFPSLYLSKKLNERDEIQLNYSRRIRRPNFWELNPFIDINDPLNIQQGNPQLKPEYSNSFEFNYSKNFKNNSNFLASIYYRNTTGDITRYSDTITTAQYDQLQNAGVDPNAILNTFINSKSTNRAGLELTLQQKFGDNFDITPNVNIGYRKVNANQNSLDLSNEGFDFSSKITANYKIKSEDKSNVFNNLSFQLTADYHSPRVIPQGRRLERFSSDFAIQKDLFKNNRGTITFSVNDIFNTQRYGVIYDTPSFYQEAYSRRWVRSFRITFSYKFGNSDFSLFRKNKDNNKGDF
ncbi:MAG: TonB-dependent receptor [Bacteroidota bacterium]|nr:TonB-dependent receptor [Bacteroidota bacterium]